MDPTGNEGGGLRFLRALLPAIVRIRPDMNVVLLGNRSTMERHGLRPHLEAAGVEVRHLRHAPAAPAARGFLQRAARRFGRGAERMSGGRGTTDLGLEVARATQRADVVHFAWPYGLEVPRSGPPLVATIHDLNFQYFFGASIFSSDRARELDRQVGEWIAGSLPVASSHFMAAEIAKFYPSAAAAVIRLAPFAEPDALTRQEAEPVVARLGVRDPYLLCPTQLLVHKNVGPLIAAVPMLRKEFPDLRLVLAGAGTEAATGRATALGTTTLRGDADVIGLGYVSDRHIAALIRSASVVVNPSLYEAGNGPGVDAWHAGVPVAMSAIPAFEEHLAEQHVEATLFDPRRPDSVAGAIASILRQPDAARVAAARSQRAIGEYTWERTASAYLDVFDRAAGAVAS